MLLSFTAEILCFCAADVAALRCGVGSGVNWWSNVMPIMKPAEAKLPVKTDSSAVTQGVSLL